MIGHFIEGAIVLKPLKGQTGYVMKLNWVCSVREKFFRIRLRHIKRFHEV